jgi:hypothetical protein
MATLLWLQTGACGDTMSLLNADSPSIERWSVTAPSTSCGTRPQRHPARRAGSADRRIEAGTSRSTSCASKAA